MISPTDVIIQMDPRHLGALVRLYEKKILNEFVISNFALSMKAIRESEMAPPDESIRFSHI